MTKKLYEECKVNKGPNEPTEGEPITCGNPSDYLEARAKLGNANAESNEEA